MSKFSAPFTLKAEKKFEKMFWPSDGLINFQTYFTEQATKKNIGATNVAHNFPVERPWKISQGSKRLVGERRLCSWCVLAAKSLKALNKFVLRKDLLKLIFSVK